MTRGASVQSGNDAPLTSHAPRTLLCACTGSGEPPRRTAGFVGDSGPCFGACAGSVETSRSKATLATLGDRGRGAGNTACAPPLLGACSGSAKPPRTKTGFASMGNSGSASGKTACAPPLRKNFRTPHQHDGCRGATTNSSMGGPHRCAACCVGSKSSMRVRPVRMPWLVSHTPIAARSSLTFSLRSGVPLARMLMKACSGARSHAGTIMTWTIPGCTPNNPSMNVHSSCALKSGASSGLKKSSTNGMPTGHSETPDAIESDATDCKR
mmetsp:Transcript_46742/g.99866  ORF Transcript_46742/g.99866 Transcript_46742/m.99866 type:complete len:268 (+) Transcript_46742:94-897(+)